MNTPGILAPKYCEDVEMQGHSITMILINTASRIREAIQAEELDAQIDLSLETLQKYFIHPEFEALLETVGPNGEFIDTIIGRTINPGHCIENRLVSCSKNKTSQLGTKANTNRFDHS